MKEDMKVCLAAIRREMQERYPYESREKRNEAFKILYHGWTQQGTRHGRNKQFFSVAWKRGWLSQRDADDLRKYIGIL